MPLYEYRCKECGNEFEKMMRFSEADQKPACPACSGFETAKKISLFSSRGTSPSLTGASTASNCAPGSFT